LHMNTQHPGHCNQNHVKYNQSRHKTKTTRPTTAHTTRLAEILS
jgi:hypothetical protein